MQPIADLIKKFLAEIKYHPFSGYTLILLSMFAWVMSILIRTESLQDFVAGLGWVFFSLGIPWVLKDVKYTFLTFTFYPSSWIGGALIVLFLTEVLELNAEIALTAWPIISGLLSLVPKFIKYEQDFIKLNPPDVKKIAPDRQSAIITLLFCLLLSNWIQFHFLVQNWLRQFPSIRADDFSRSAFVVQVGQANPPLVSRGALYLEQMEPLLTNAVQNMTLSEVEQFLLPSRLENEIRGFVQFIQRERMAQFPQEDRWWFFQWRTATANPGYRLELRAVWDGPTSVPGGFYARKICQIAESFDTDRPLTPDQPQELTPTTRMRVTCGPTEDRVPRSLENAPTSSSPSKLCPVAWCTWRASRTTYTMQSFSSEALAKINV